MTIPREPQPDTGWADDEGLAETDVDFDAVFDGQNAIDGDGANEVRVLRRESSVPLWRLIEMSGEDRELRMALADLGDYEDFEKFGRKFMDELPI